MIRNWWQEFWQSDFFSHPRGFEARIKKAKDRIPPLLQDNERVYPYSGSFDHSFLSCSSFFRTYVGYPKWC